MVEERADSVDVAPAACGNVVPDPVVPVDLGAANDMPPGVAGEHTAQLGIGDVGDGFGGVAVQPGGVLITGRQNSGDDEQRAQIGHREHLRSRRARHG